MDYYQLYETIDGPSGLLDFVLRALQALRPCDGDPIVHTMRQISSRTASFNVILIV